MAGKKAKTAVHYRGGGPTKHCGICTMFRRPDRCTAVKGEIKRTALCDLFKRKPLNA